MSAEVESVKLHQGDSIVIYNETKGCSIVVSGLSDELEIKVIPGPEGRVQRYRIYDNGTKMTGMVSAVLLLHVMEMKNYYAST